MSTKYYLERVREAEQVSQIRESGRKIEQFITDELLKYSDCERADECRERLLATVRIHCTTMDTSAKTLVSITRSFCTWYAVNGVKALRELMADAEQKNDPYRIVDEYGTVFSIDRFEKLIQSLSGVSNRCAGDID